MFSRVEPFSNMSSGVQRVLLHHMSSRRCFQIPVGTLDLFVFNLMISHLFLFNNFPLMIATSRRNSSQLWHMHILFYRLLCKSIFAILIQKQCRQCRERELLKINDCLSVGFRCVHLGTFLFYCEMSHLVSSLSICLVLSSLSICCSLSLSCPTAFLVVPHASAPTVCLSEDSRTHSPTP